jgi:hypothetical protein
MSAACGGDDAPGIAAIGRQSQARPNNLPDGASSGEASYPSTAAPPPVTEVFPFFFRTTMKKVRNMDRPRRPFHTDFR